MFVDEVDIRVTAGDGGRGCISFRREKFVPRGGPDGGDGGPGGSVYLVASPHFNTLASFRHHPEFKAQRGGHGEGSNRTGKTGADLDVEVPIGTVALGLQDGELTQMADLTRPGQRVLIAKGGRGGRGNTRFVSATNRAPRRADTGDAGESVQLHLRLKLIADVGIVGFPNAGKSTLIARISAARPKIADYPFTTLTPNLGVVLLSDDRSFVAADVPGLIEGAHHGAGLGHRFLGHVERTKVLLHLVDVSATSGRNPVDDFKAIQHELTRYEPDVIPGQPKPTSLAERPQIVVATKIDALDDKKRLTALRRYVKRLGLECHAVSSATGEGIEALLEATWSHVAAGRTEPDDMLDAPRARVPPPDVEP